MKRVLGLDLGVASVGWALADFEKDKPEAVVAIGARVFQPGVDGDFGSGKEESRNKVRRDARMGRRQTQRRARRMRWIAELLQETGLLPDGPISNGERRHALLQELDRTLYEKLRAEVPPLLLDQLPYYLRTRALDAPLSKHELGRTIYHLAQRRGFWSNRKAPARDEDESRVKTAIADLADKIKASNRRTLGEYLAHVDPHAEQRIRGRWTGRDMYREEFEAIWDAQQQAHADTLTPELKARLTRALFHQRPLRSQRALIARCELEPEEKRAPWALLLSQRFRLLQRVNDLTYQTADGEVHALTPEQRSKVLNLLEGQQEVSFGKLRQKSLLALSKGTTFNLERGGEKRLIGNRTAAKLRDVFGDRWDSMTTEEREGVVRDVRSIRLETTLVRRAIRAYGLDKEAATKLGKLQLEDCAYPQS